MKLNVLVPNMWTSKGKAFEGDVVEVPDSEGSELLKQRVTVKGKPVAKVELVKAGAK